MAKAKSKFVLVLLESIVSKHKFVQQRARLDDKLELWKFDPYSKRARLHFDDVCSRSTVKADRKPFRVKTLDFRFNVNRE